MAEKETKSIDQGTIELIEKAADDSVNTAFDRADTMKPCPTSTPSRVPSSMAAPLAALLF